jgi:hypothetical protein
MRFEYQAWAMCDGTVSHGVREEIIANDMKEAITKSWRRAVYHLYTINDNTIQMLYVKEM